MMKIFILLFLFKIFLSQEILNITKQTEIFNKISSKTFKGSWNFLENNNTKNKDKLFNSFHNKSGIFSLTIKFSQYPINKLILSFYIQLFDGLFRENWVSIILYYIVKDSDLNYNELKHYRENYKNYIIEKYIEYTKRKKDFILEIPNENSNNVFIIKNRFENKTIIKSLKLFQTKNLLYEPIDNLTLFFSLNNETNNSFMNGSILLTKLNLNISFSGISKQEYFINSISKKSQFFFFLSLICFFHFLSIYSILRKRCKDNSSNFDNFSSLLIGLDIGYNALICLSNISISSNDYLSSNFYAFNSLMYFFLFGFFESILFYFSFNLENYKGLIQLIVISLFSLLIFLLLINFLFIYQIFINIFFYTTFIPQIIYNVSFKEKPNSIPIDFQISLLLNRLYVPLYLKGKKDNIFNSKTNFFFCFSLIFINGYQMFLLFMQGKISGDYIIPKNCKKNNYKYKKNLWNLMNKNLEFYNYQCSVCLNPFTINEFINPIRENKLFFCIKKLFLKPILIYETPCHHYFHIDCLDNWLKRKKECPVCRTQLPDIM